MHITFSKSEINPFTQAPYFTQEEYETYKNLSQGERDALTRLARNPSFKTNLLPNLRRGADRCLSAPFPLHLGYDPTNPTPSAYATQVSGSPHDFFVMLPDGRHKFFDGLTPGTRQLWEAKYGYRGVAQNPEQFGNVISNILYQALDQVAISSGCRYGLTWAFSDPLASYFFKTAFQGNPAYPQDVRYIPYIA